MINNATNIIDSFKKVERHRVEFGTSTEFGFFNYLENKDLTSEREFTSSFL